MLLKQNCYAKWSCPLSFLDPLKVSEISDKAQSNSLVFFISPCHCGRAMKADCLSKASEIWRKEKGANSLIIDLKFRPFASLDESSSLAQILGYSFNSHI